MGTPAFLANDGELAIAAMKLCCFLLVLGIISPLKEAGQFLLQAC
jgi:hypothetical protein